jgi:hypothetical protein
MNFFIFIISFIFAGFSIIAFHFMLTICSAILFYLYGLKLKELIKGYVKVTLFIILSEKN